ncbi:unnamed protein product [Rotaria sp. Silwood1]|nr:unnamed protein product [Rotaria sp. Silwood1]
MIFHDVVTGETGLGQAAAAGIACGIIFSALIFTGEIIFFKVFHASGSDRAFTCFNMFIYTRLFDRGDSTINDIENIQLNTQFIYDNQTKQEYELKILSLIQSSSLSTLASLNNKNSFTNSSEYDNLMIKDTYQSLETQSPFKVTFNQNYQLK